MRRLSVVVPDGPYPVPVDPCRGLTAGARDAALADIGLTPPRPQRRFGDDRRVSLLHGDRRTHLVWVTCTRAGLVVCTCERCPPPPWAGAP